MSNYVFRVIVAAEEALTDLSGQLIEIEHVAKREVDDYLVREMRRSRKMLDEIEDAIAEASDRYGR